MMRGRPFQPGNKFGRGRPLGSRNKRSTAQRLFEDHSGALMGMAIVRAREDPQMLRMLVGRIAPQRGDIPVQIGPVALNTLEDLDRTSEAVIKKASAGKITWNQAAQVSEVIEGRRHLLETRDLEQRISDLESAGGLQAKA